ncbi:zinc knuckle CX2CX4HX4C containing protein [Tanacetum coccineum]
MREGGIIIIGKKTTTDAGTGSALGSDGIPYDATPRVDAAMKVVSLSVVEETVSMECPVVNTPGVGPNPPSHTQDANALAGNAPGKPSYAIAIGKPSGKKVNVRTLYTPGGNGIDVVVPVDSIRAISEQFANTAYGFFLGKKVAYPVVANYVRNTWGKYGLVRSMFSSSTGLFSFQFSSFDGLDAMLENDPWFIRNNPLILKKWHPDENLLKQDVSTIPVWVKLYGVPVTTFSEDVLSTIATKLSTPLMLESYTSDISSGNKKKCVEPTTKVSNSNPFDVINSVDNDVEFASNTPIGEKMDKIERPICEGKIRLLDNDGNPLVPTGIAESDSEVEMVFDETANLRIPTSGNDRSDKGYGTNSLLEQWRDSYPDNDDYDPYDDDMYENHDLSENLRSICDDLDIMVLGRKKEEVLF